MGGLKTERPSLESRNNEQKSKKGRPCQALPEKSIRFDNIGHLPSLENIRRVCKKPGCTGKTNVLCSKCKVNLCFNINNNCFANFHSNFVN